MLSQEEEFTMKRAYGLTGDYRKQMVAIIGEVIGIKTGIPADAELCLCHWRNHSDEGWDDDLGWEDTHFHH